MAPTPKLTIALAGSKFMGRAHSNAWMSAPKFFTLPREIVMSSICATDAKATEAFARQWGWERSTTDYRRGVADDRQIDLVDICTPNHLHAEHAVLALESGKHVACEKPLARTLDEARLMCDIARKAAKKGAMTFVWFNYRRCPAVAFARQLVQAGRLGRIHHVRAAYLQDWGRAETPMLWRFDASKAGSGAHGDLNAHIIDMARFITGDEIVEVAGAIERTFVRERRNAGSAGSLSGSPCGGRSPSTVDDAVLFLANFAGGAVASFEATRVATGNQNRNQIEINGDRGSIRFDFERMNELLWWDDTLDAGVRGWSRIMCTNAADHPYAAAYWPPAHLIGYEHTFVSQAADIVRAIAGEKPIVPLPDFDDALRTQMVLEAAILSARSRRPVPIAELERA